jgi:hypothetical protein
MMVATSFFRRRREVRSMVDRIGSNHAVPREHAPAAAGHARRAGGADFQEALKAAPAAPPPERVPERSVVARVLTDVATGQREMDRIIHMAKGGRTFSSAELLGMQARIYRLSQELDLASKLVEKATGGVKQAMSTQV